MANEISGNVSLAIASGPRRAFCGVNFGLTLTSDEMVLQDQNVGTAAGGYLMAVNAAAAAAGYLSLVDDASDKVCALAAGGGFALLPMKGGGQLYCRGADTSHIPLFVTN